jgi:hypothetical protein
LPGTAAQQDEVALFPQSNDFFVVVSIDLAAPNQRAHVGDCRVDDDETRLPRSRSRQTADGFRRCSTVRCNFKNARPYCIHDSFRRLDGSLFFSE